VSEVASDAPAIDKNAGFHDCAADAQRHRSIPPSGGNMNGSAIEAGAKQKWKRGVRRTFVQRHARGTRRRGIEAHVPPELGARELFQLIVPIRWHRHGGAEAGGLGKSVALEIPFWQEGELPFAVQVDVAYPACIDHGS